jgi:hypothetical protein
MKLQEQGLISLEWLDKKIAECKNSHNICIDRDLTKRAHLYLEKMWMLQMVKSHLKSPILLAEKIWDEGYKLGLSGTPKDTLLFDTCKQTFLNSDIKID